MTPRPTATGPTRRQWLLAVCLFLLSLPAVTPRIYSSDEIQYFAFLRSLWFDHDLSFENEYQYFYDRGIARSEGFRQTFLELKTDTGRRINFGTIGCAILWAPFYLAGDLAARATGAPVDGFSTPYVAAIAYGSALYGFLALVLAASCARRLGLGGALPAVAVGAGTPLIFYMYVAPPFSHACSAFAVALFTYVWLRIRDDWSVPGVMALGAAGALMGMVREQDLLLVAGPALDFGLWAAGGVGQSPQSLRPKAQSLVPSLIARVAAGTGAFAVTFAPQSAAYLTLNGHLGPHSSVAHKMNWMAPHALDVLFSPEHGFFVWTPLALVAIAGLGVLMVPPKGGSYTTDIPVASAFRRKRQIGACLLVMVALQIYSSGSVQSWTVAGGFGQRRFIALTTALVIGLAALRHRASDRGGRVFMALTALAVYWNLAMIAEFSTGLMDRQKLEPRRNAYDAFVTLPREAPSLAYRYLFDRSSFYKHGF